MCLKRCRSPIDKIQIRTFGQGLALRISRSYIVLTDPELLNKMSPACGKNLRWRCQNSSFKADGFRNGSTHSKSGDIDLISSDKKLLSKTTFLICAGRHRRHDRDASFGWCHRGGAVTVAVVIHGDSHLSGHGPGMATIMTSSTGAIVPKNRRTQT